MSLALSTRFTRHSWAMPAVPGFPLGVWSASNDDEGNNTGGVLSFQHIFRNTSNGLGDTNLYNIEHVMASSMDAGNTGCKLTINGMDPGTGQLTFPPRPIDRVYMYPMVPDDTGVLFRSSIEPSKGTVPIWVGTYDGPDTDLGDMLLSFQNIDSARIVVAVYGYYWAPGAVNAPGGIQRPPNGLWRA